MGFHLQEKNYWKYGSQNNYLRFEKFREKLLPGSQLSFESLEFS